MILVIIAGALFITYCIAIGILPSISQSFYELKKNGLAFVFTLFLFSISVLIIFAARTRFMTIAGLFIIGVSIFPYFLKQKWQHYLCALSGLGLGMVSLVVDFDQILIVVIGVSTTILLYILKVKNLFYWIEVTLFLTIIVGLIAK